MVSRRLWKAVVAALVLYWPAIFVLTHIPMERIVHESRLSDKSLHFVAYMILTLLLWSAAQPGRKVRWFHPAPWLVLAVVMAYGICDEYLQQFIAGRSMDARDLIADALGAGTALAVLTVLSFWSAALLVTGLTIFSVAVVVRANLAARVPMMIMAFYFGAHAVLTLLWIGFLRETRGSRRPAGPQWVLSVSAPLALLVVTKVTATLADRPFDRWHMVAGLAGIAGVTLAVPLAGRFRRGNAAAGGVSGAEAQSFLNGR
jgi:VanZ family protein